MKRALKFSLFLNLLFAGWIIFLAQRPPTSEYPKSMEPATSSDGAPARPDRNQSDTQTRFRWSQLESTDYRQYISNLQSVGCPRQTIRDIITADVHSLYAARSESVSRESMSTQLRDQKLEALHEEENSVLMALIGPPCSAQPTDQNISAEPASRTPQNNNVSIPLAFRSIDFSALNLNDEQAQSVQYLRNAFQGELRDSGRDSSSPEYLKRWQTAQAQNDLMLRGTLGTKLYEQIESQRDIAPESAR